MIRLALRARPPRRLSLDGIVPERLAALGAGEIERLPLRDGNCPCVVADWFAVQAEGGGEARLVIAGESTALAMLDAIGGGMAGGEVTVEGDAGAYAGLAMSGGRLVIAGSAGHGAATAMRGGEMRIGGDAGDQLGGALPGEKSGMRGGTVIVAGDTGSGAGDRMRRGLILVRGDAGPFCGARMAAGTIVVGGRVGAHAGLAMRRGSLLALGGLSAVLPSFRDSGRPELIFQRLLARLLEREGMPELAPTGPLRRWTGDHALGGRGEILAAG